MEQNQQPLPPVFNPQQAQQPSQPAAPQYQPRVTASPMMQPVEAVTRCLKKYIDFKGRARRSEFWWFALFVLVVSSALMYLSGLVPGISYVSALFSIAMFIPLLAALTRRLHDTNRSGWWVVILVLCFVGYYGLTTYLISPSLEKFENSTDILGMADAMADSVQSSPGVATLMALCSVGTILFFIIDHIFAAFDSKWDENKYGPSPKYK